jgi:hypothetical protein
MLVPKRDEPLTTKYSAWLELKCRGETGGAVFASIENVLRWPELQSLLATSAKRKFKRLKNEPRVAEDRGGRRDV